MVASRALGELLRRSPGPRRAPGRGRAGCRSPPRRRSRWRRGRRRTCPRNSITLSWFIDGPASFPSAGAGKHRLGRRLSWHLRCCRRADTQRACCRPEVGRRGRSGRYGWRCSGRCGWSSTARRSRCRGPKRRAVLALLALAEGRTVTVDHLVDALWPAEAPESGRQALHTHVSRLRAHLGPAADRLQTRHGRLPARPRRRRPRRRRRRAALLRPRRATDAPRRWPLLQEAHALWRGPVLADLTDVAPIATAVEGCARLHREVTDALIAARRRRRAGRRRRSALAADALRRRSAARAGGPAADARAGRDRAGSRGAADRPRVPAPAGRRDRPGPRRRRWARWNATSRAGAGTGPARLRRAAHRRGRPPGCSAARPRSRRCTGCSATRAAGHGRRAGRRRQDPGRPGGRRRGATRRPCCCSPRSPTRPRSRTRWPRR